MGVLCQTKGQRYQGWVCDGGSLDTVYFMYIYKIYRQHKGR